MAALAAVAAALLSAAFFFFSIAFFPMSLRLFITPIKYPGRFDTGRSFNCLDRFLSTWWGTT